MLEFHEKRKLQRFLYSRYFLVFMCIPVAFLTYAAQNAYRAERESHVRRVELQTELAALEARAETLEANIARLEDPYGVEAELRQRYEVGAEGEEVIVLVEDQNQDQAPTTTPTEVPTTWWQHVTSWF